MSDGDIMERIDPQPPPGIKYVLGGESWLPAGQRSPYRLICEEWGNLGPMELDPEIGENAAGLRVRLTEIMAPPGARGFTYDEGGAYWTRSSVWDVAREAEET